MNDDNINPIIIIDKRELRSPISKAIEKLGADMRFETLDVGDYVVSARCGFERKTTDDFLKSWLDKKTLFSQLHDLKNSYGLPILLIEGDELSLFTARKVDPKAVQGCLFAIARMRIPVLFTLNAYGTANALYWYASKEQDTTDKRAFSPHGKRSHMNSKQKKEYVISSFPDCDVGTKKAIDLLKHFRSIKKIINASPEELQEVPGVGKVIAESINKLVTEEYDSLLSADKILGKNYEKK